MRLLHYLVISIADGGTVTSLELPLSEEGLIGFSRAMFESCLQLLAPAYSTSALNDKLNCNLKKLITRNMAQTNTGNHPLTGQNCVFKISFSTDDEIFVKMRSLIKRFVVMIAFVPSYIN